MNNVISTYKTLQMQIKMVVCVRILKQCSFSNVQLKLLRLYANTRNE